MDEPIALQIHAQSAAGLVRAIDVRLARRAQSISVEFAVRIAADLPPLGPVMRGHDLWEETCFELFLQVEGDPGYYEWNLAPDGRWAAYRLPGYRGGLSEDHAITPGAFSNVAGADGGWIIARELCLAADHPLAGSAPLRFGASVIDRLGAYPPAFWALAHPPGAPDFHSPTCFAGRLAAPAAP